MDEGTVASWLWQAEVLSLFKADESSLRVSKY